jgi:lysyl-tRNA synthetase class 1
MEFDRGVANTQKEDYDKTVFDLCLFKNTKAAGQVSFGTLATVAPLAEFDKTLTEKMLGTKVCAQRIEKVKFWLENYAPEKIYKLRDSFNTEFFASLSDTEKETLAKLENFLQTTRTEKDIQEFLYAIINDPNATKKENITAQQRYFKIFYNMLFGRDDGPRLYLYLAVADKKTYLKWLYPR